jgi:hypothetical protein
MQKKTFFVFFPKQQVAIFMGGSVVAEIREHLASTLNDQDVVGPHMQVNLSLGVHRVMNL